jgi:nitrogen fixation protein NifB
MIANSKVRELHPCFGAKENAGRIHLPVCPECNIECNFCDRKFGVADNRPGVAAYVISPEESLAAVKRAIELCPTIRVVGIAGPGDALVSDKAIETFRLIGREHPHLLKCMSTNGLLLLERADELIELGLDSLTVTVNAVDPLILSQIVARIHYHGEHLAGADGANVLIRNQLEGIRKVKRANVTVKANIVLIPEINRSHIKDTAKALSEAGADMLNIIPLIPQHKLAHCSQPDCEDLYAARQEAEEYLEVFRHCQRCRADAVGVPGQSDFSAQIYEKRLVLKDTFSHG